MKQEVLLTKMYSQLIRNDTNNGLYTTYCIFNQLRTLTDDGPVLICFSISTMGPIQLIFAKYWTYRNFYVLVAFRLVFD